MLFVLYFYNNQLYINRYGYGDDGNLRYPTSTVVTPEHTVLIADRENNRISEYSLDDGRFIRHVLTEDGINSPQFISLQGDLLWLSFDVTDSYNSDKNIRCYKLYTD